MSSLSILNSKAIGNPDDLVNFQLRDRALVEKASLRITT